MVRVASLKDMVHANYTKRDIAGMTAQEQLDAIDGKTHELVENQYRTYNRMLLPLLKQHGLRVVTEHEKLTKEEAVYVDRYFEESVYPVLTPMAVDSSRPFPLIHNKSLNIAALVRKKKGRRASWNLRWSACRAGFHAWWSCRSQGRANPSFIWKKSSSGISTNCS